MRHCLLPSPIGSMHRLTTRQGHFEFQPISHWGRSSWWKRVIMRLITLTWRISRFRTKDVECEMGGRKRATGSRAKPNLGSSGVPRFQHQPAILASSVCTAYRSARLSGDCGHLRLESSRALLVIPSDSRRPRIAHANRVQKVLRSCPIFDAPATVSDLSDLSSLILSVTGSPCSPLKTILVTVAPRRRPRPPLRLVLETISSRSLLASQLPSSLGVRPFRICSRAIKPGTLGSRALPVRPRPVKSAAQSLLLVCKTATWTSRVGGARTKPQNCPRISSWRSWGQSGGPLHTFRTSKDTAQIETPKSTARIE